MEEALIEIEPKETKFVFKGINYTIKYKYKKVAGKYTDWNPILDLFEIISIEGAGRIYEGETFLDTLTNKEDYENFSKIICGLKE